MKILLCALNSKFIHSSLSVRCLYSHAAEYGENIDVREFTINNSIDYILKEIYGAKPDVICFSCYIWNIEMIKEICTVIEKIMPEVKIVLGGPEVSFPPFNLEEYHAHIICFGEGEETFRQLAGHFVEGSKDLAEIDGIVYIDNGKTIVNKAQPLLDLNELAFPYAGLDDLENKIIYYESTRGCPYNCAYCLSSTIEGVRYLELSTVFKQLKLFIEQKVQQVKFVDRTFNCHKQRAFDIWKFIIENDNGITNFHFEIGADLLENNHIELLKTARDGLIQFEAGVQSTNSQTLDVVCRTTDLRKLYDNVAKIKALGNIHLHLDLIAGLPYEDYESFKQSFDDVFELRPEMLQLGFLKLLKGSKLRIEALNHGIEFREKAPYEVLFTKEISFEKLLKLKDIENVLEIYYNSNMFKASVEYALSFFGSPFEFFEKLAKYWHKNEYYKISHTKHKLFEILFEFSSEIKGIDADIFKDFLKFDLFFNENTKNLPQWLNKTDYGQIKINLDNFFSDAENHSKYFSKYSDFSPKQLSRICHVENFKLDVLKWIESGVIEKCEQYCLFVYGGKNERTFVYNIEI